MKIIFKEITKMKIFSLVISGTWHHNKMRGIVNSVGQKFVWVHRNPHQKKPRSPTNTRMF